MKLKQLLKSNTMKNILKSWYKLLLTSPTEKSVRRFRTCKKCTKRNKLLNTCKLCGCYVPALVFTEFNYCDKWDEDTKQ